MKKNKIIYSEILYCLDIETSTTTVEKNDISFMYSFCISRLNFYNGQYEEYTKGRTYADLTNELEKLSKLAGENTIIMYIHNISYEWSFFLNNVKFFDNMNFSQKPKFENENNFLFLSSNKPLFIRNKHIELRCSSLLVGGLSVHLMGNAINLQKLDYEYEKMRTPLTPMSREEWEYNMRDTEIVLKYIYEKIIKLNELIETPTELPYTRTGLTRFNMRKNKQINQDYFYTNKKGKKVKTNLYSLWLLDCKRNKAISKKQIHFWNDILFDGAIVYSSPFYTSKVLENIDSFDYCSDYPFQMDCRFYPFDFKEIENRKMYELIHLSKDLSINDLIKPRIANTYFNAIISIKNVTPKFKFYPLSVAKILNIKDFRNDYNIRYINGKLIEVSETIQFPCTIIKYIMLKEFYNFELVSVDYLETTDKVEKTHPYLQNTINFLAKNKSKIKKQVELIEDIGHFKIYTKTQITDETTRTIINLCKTYTEQVNTINDIYLLSKGDLNAQYGNNAQHLIRKIYLYSKNEKEYFDYLDDNEYFENNQKTSYIYGLYIPQYAQASILYIAYQFCKNDIPILYIDTDSIKTFVSEIARKIVEKYNQKIKDLGCQTTNLYGFGLLENEFTASKFCSLGSKTYLYIKQGTNKIKATISGLPNASKIYNEIYEQFNYNFEKLVRLSYHYGIIFDTKICTKLTSSYKYIECDIDIDGYKEHLISGVVLKKTECAMKDFISNSTWYAYKNILVKYFNIPLSNFSECRISKKYDKKMKKDIYIFNE